MVETRGQLLRKRSTKLSTYLCPKGHTLANAPAECHFGHRPKPGRGRGGHTATGQTDNLRPVPVGICVDHIVRGDCTKGTAAGCSAGLHPTLDDLSDLDGFLRRAIPLEAMSSSSSDTSSSSLSSSSSSSSAAVTSAMDHIYEAIAELDKLHLWDNPLEYRNRVRDRMYDALDELRPIAPPAKNINDSLPDDCLVTIFAKGFSMQSMIGTLSLVCTRWKDIVESSVCATKSGLKIFAYKPTYASLLLEFNLYSNPNFKLWPVGHLRDNDLYNTGPRSRKLNEPFLRLLGDLFANIQHLVFGFGRFNDCGIGELTQLLGRMSKLTHLTLLIQWGEDRTKDPSALTDAINSLSTLKRLDFLDNYIVLIVPQLSPVLLSQLNSLTLAGSEYTVQSLASIDSLVGHLGDTFRELRLDHYEINRETLSLSAICTNTDFSTRITHLRLSKIDCTSSQQVVQLVCSKFINLKRLELAFEDVNIKKSWKDARKHAKRFVYDPVGARNNKIDYTKYACSRMDRTLITNLAQLAHLEELSLAWVQLDLHSLLQSSTSSNVGASLPRIKSLQLTNILCTRVEHDTDELLIRAIAATFPNLEQIDFQYGKVFERYTFDASQFQQRIPSLRKCRIYWFQCLVDRIGRHQYQYSKCACVQSYDLDSDSDDSDGL